MLEYLVYSLSDKAFKGTVVNRALLSLPGGLLEIKPTVPLTVSSIHKFLALPSV